MFKLEFETLNAGIQSSEEIGRILKHVKQDVEGDKTSGKIRDVNGNSIGSWSWEQDFELIELTREQKFKVDQLVMLLENDSSFYFSQIRPLLEYHASRMFDGTYNEKKALFDVFKEIVKACRMGSVRNLGPLSTKQKQLTAEVLLDKYQEEIDDITQDMRDDANE